MDPARTFDWQPRSRDLSTETGRSSGICVHKRSTFITLLFVGNWTHSPFTFFIFFQRILRTTTLFFMLTSSCCSGSVTLVTGSSSTLSWISDLLYNCHCADDASFVSKTVGNIKQSIHFKNKLHPRDSNPRPPGCERSHPHRCVTLAYHI